MRMLLGSDEVIELGQGPEGEFALSEARGALEAWTTAYSAEAGRLIARQASLALEGGVSVWDGWVRETGMVGVGAAPTDGEVWEATRSAASRLLGEAQQMASSGIRVFRPEGLRRLSMEMERTLGAIERSVTKARPIRAGLAGTVNLLSDCAAAQLSGPRERLSVLLGRVGLGEEAYPASGVSAWISDHWAWLLGAAGLGLGVAVLASVGRR